MTRGASGWQLLQQAGEQGTDRDADYRTAEQEWPERLLLCRACLGEVTSSRRATSKGGQHRHAFFNPHGLLFEIGLFSSAPGCLAAGVATGEFSWFAGFYWRHALCAGCGAHLGWRFERDDEFFWGLVLDRLLEQ